MAVSKFYLDTRRPSEDGAFPLKLTFTKNHRNVYIGLDVRLLPSQWDGKHLRVTGRPDRAVLNAHIARRKTDIDAAILRLSESAEWSRLSAYQVRDMVTGREETDKSRLFAARFRAFTDLKTKPTTRKLYLNTLNHLRAFDPDLESREFRDINVDYLTRLDVFMARTAPSRNARNIHLRNIRAVFNAAIDDEITTSYPFRRFKIRPEATAKRSLSVENLRTLFNYPVEEWQREYLDMFKLIFFLEGINMVDLFNLAGISPDGRIEYRRAKTGRLYSVKVEPEAMEIIERHRGKTALLEMHDRYKDHYDYMHHINDALKRIGPSTRSGRGGRKSVAPLFPQISTYWARHSWATIAASLDIPKETIAAGLGHGGNTVTDIYIDFDRRKVDAANRKIIDWVLYGKK